MEQLRASRACESHWVMSASGALTALQQPDLKRGDFEGRADLGHNVKDISATIASGSLHSLELAPCSMKTLASIALGLRWASCCDASPSGAAPPAWGVQY